MFEKKWHFPHCIGALDGKHISMYAPPNSGSMFYNYKGNHSIVLMALADANYKISYFDIGCKGRISDGGVFNQCSLSEGLEKNTLNVPSAKPIFENGPSMPYVIVADDAFALKSYLMKPFPFRSLSGPERVYNYRLSRARRIVENVFGIMSARFQLLLKRIRLDEDKTKRVVLAICALHNFLMTVSDKYASPSDFDREAEDGSIIPGRWRSDCNAQMEPLSKDPHSKNSQMNAKCVQNNFKDYFVSSKGEVPWQYSRI